MRTRQLILGIGIAFLIFGLVILIAWSVAKHYGEPLSAERLLETPRGFVPPSASYYVEAGSLRAWEELERRVGGYRELAPSSVGEILFPRNAAVKMILGKPLEFGIDPERALGAAALVNRPGEEIRVAFLPVGDPGRFAARFGLREEDFVETAVLFGAGAAALRQGYALVSDSPRNIDDLLAIVPRISKPDVIVDGEAKGVDDVLSLTLRKEGAEALFADFIARADSTLLPETTFPEAGEILRDIEEAEIRVSLDMDRTFVSMRFLLEEGSGTAEFIRRREEAGQGETWPSPGEWDYEQSGAGKPIRYSRIASGRAIGWEAIVPVQADVSGESLLRGILDQTFQKP